MWVPFRDFFFFFFLKFFYFKKYKIDFFLTIF
jgi:hypothetical protein